MDKDYSQMNMDELDQAKYALEKQRAELKEQMRKAKDEDKESWHQKIKMVRADMLLIQEWQDRITSTPRKPGTRVHTLGLKGIPSQAQVMTDAKTRRKK